MRNNKIFKAIAISAPVVLLSTAVYAATVTPIFVFQTITDVSIDNAQTLNFGVDNILPKANGKCKLEPTITAVTAGLKLADATEADPTLSGDACLNGAVAGDAKTAYLEITGAASTAVTITLTNSDPAETRYSFVPEALYFNDADAGGVADATISSSVPGNVTLGTGGLALLAIGGELTIGAADLDYATVYNATTYTVEVTY